MNAEAILLKIEEDALQTAAKISGDAKAKAEELRAASREKIEGMHRAMLAQAEKDCAELEERMLRMADLEIRKSLLAQKRALIDSAFSGAASMLAAAPDGDKRAFFLSQITHYAEGNEVLAIGERDAAWFDGAFLADANAALAAAGKPAELTLATERCKGCTGIMLAAGGAEIRCTFDALLDEARAAMEQQVAVALFGDA